MQQRQGQVVGLAPDDVVFLTLKLLQRNNLVALQWMLGAKPVARPAGDGVWVVEGERATLRVKVERHNGHNGWVRLKLLDAEVKG